MYILRNAKISDLEDVYLLSKEANLLNLPRDKTKLLSLIKKSNKSFNSPDNELENNYDISALYTEMIKNYGTRLFTGEIKHKFKNGNGTVIDTLEGYELARCIRSTITFRLYEKKYFTNKDKLNWAGSKLTFKAKYVFAFTIRIIIDLYYKIYRLFLK